MKISFSTLGCPGWSWNEIIAMAKDLGYDGIEVRGIKNELYVPKIEVFLPENIETTKMKLENLGLDIPCLTSACNLSDKANINTQINEGKEYIDLANKLNIPFIRVLGDPNPNPEENIDFNFTAESLTILAEYAKDKGVKILIETNGIYANSHVMLKLMDILDNPHIGILWDVHHPYRFFNESIEETYRALKDYIEFIHIKDSVIISNGNGLLASSNINNRIKYKMMGYGDVPVKEALRLLKREGYDGYVSLEWVKRWNKELEEPGIVFSHYINFVKGVIK